MAANSEADPQVTLSSTSSSAHLTTSSLAVQTRRRDYEGEDDSGNWDHHSYMRIKRRKLQDQYLSLGQQESTIFAGVTIYVNGHTHPTADELKLLIQAHGGGYEYMPYSSRITHIIASNLPTAKIRRLTEKSTAVCKPAWIVDSVAAGKQLPVDQYRLYSVADKSQRRLNFGLPKTKNERDFKKDSEWVDPEEETEMKDDSPTSVPHPVSPGSVSHNGDFVSEFYSHSRLHYLSTWGTELKQFTSRMLPQAVQKIPRLPSSSSLRSQQSRAVVHIDVDCFFVQVSIMDKPHLKGTPVAVTHAKNTSSHNPIIPSTSFTADVPVDTSKDSEDGTVAGPGSQGSTSVLGRLLHSTSDVASCSYEARRCGIKNGMSVGKALKLCPDLSLVPYEFDKYRKVSQTLYETLMSYSHLVEAVSCDEAYVELTDYAADYDSVEVIVKQIRAEVEGKTGCTVSAGISHNMLLARMATRKAKPNGQYYLPTSEVQSYLADQPAADLPGVGWSLRQRLESMDITTCSDLQKVPLAKLKGEFGEKTGDMLYRSCRGESDRQLKLVSERKSISVDINFGIRFTQFSEAKNHVHQLARELQKRANEASVSGSCVTLKMKIRKASAPVQTRKYLGHGACDNVSRSVTLDAPTRSTEEISKAAVQLLKSVNPTVPDIRGMGLQLTKLVSGSSPLKKAVAGSSDIRSLFTSRQSSSSTMVQAPSERIQGLKQATTSKGKSDIRTLFSAQQHCQPSTSSGKGSEATGTSDAADYNFNLDLPPLSQLDCSVLLELPAELQENIFDSYLEKANKASSSKSISAVPAVKPVSKQPEPCAQSLIGLSEKTIGGRIIFEDQTKFVFEMRERIREWVRTFTEGPNDTDVEAFRYFLITLCPQNMEVTDAALKCFRRSAVRQNHPLWYNTFNSVLSSVQDVMQTHYGSTLQIDQIQIPVD